VRELIEITSLGDEARVYLLGRWRVYEWIWWEDVVW